MARWELSSALACQLLGLGFDSFISLGQNFDYLGLRWTVVLGSINVIVVLAHNCVHTMDKNKTVIPFLRYIC